MSAGRIIHTPPRARKDWLGIYLRGLAMGVAEVIPGVSGGTIAFITGIYGELLATLAHVSVNSLRLLFGRGLKAFWLDHNLTFLLFLGTGMLTSFALFAGLLSRLIDNNPIMVWSFFFGLIAASVVSIARHSDAGHLLSGGLLGCAAAVLLAVGVPMELQPNNTVLFLGGMAAVTAWLLPGVSGSYLLLMLGLYPVVLQAAAHLNFAILAVLAAGCVAGLLLFSKLLAWLLQHYRTMLMAILTGFTAGSLLKLWPWKLLQSDYQIYLPVLPQTYRQHLDQDAFVPQALVALAAGILIVGVLSWHERRSQSSHSPDAGRPAD